MLSRREASLKPRVRLHERFTLGHLRQTRTRVQDVSMGMDVSPCAAKSVSAFHGHLKYMIQRKSR
jgi:hypothetical protein